MENKPTLIERVLSPVLDRYMARKAQVQYPAWLLAAAEVEKYNLPNMDMPQKQAELYQRLSWVRIAVGVVAKAAASVPLEVLREIGEEAEGIPNHPFELLLKRPNPMRSRFEFLEATFLYYQLTGNAYWWLNRANENAPPDEMFVMPSHRIRPVPDGNMALKGYLYDPGDGREIPLEPWEVVHFKQFNPFSRYLGMSPIEAFATVAVGDMAQQKWNTQFYADDNAKIPGVLSFADPIQDSDWLKLQEEVKEQGKKRNMLMLRNTGQGGVAWTAMNLSQKDMEFLAARSFNRQEIYDIYAPGLNQWLAPDTNNANSRSGRDAFYELAIFPLHTAHAETVANKILPAYADNLTAQFEDVRPKDQALELQKQQAYAQVHTIDEIRAMFYQTDALGDERGFLLPAEVTKSGGAGGFDVGLPGRDVVQPEQPQDDDDEQAAKMRERDQFRRFAQKRMDEGKPEKIEAFEFEHLDPSEVRALKAEYVQPASAIVERLGEVLQVLRSEQYAERAEAVE